MTKLHRRRLLQAGSAATAAAFVPSSLRAADRIKMRIGVVPLLSSGPIYVAAAKGSVRQGRARRRDEVLRRRRAGDPGARCRRARRDGRDAQRRPLQRRRQGRALQARPRSRDREAEWRLDDHSRQQQDVRGGRHRHDEIRAAAGQAHGDAGAWRDRSLPARARLPEGRPRSEARRLSIPPASPIPIS